MPLDVPHFLERNPWVIFALVAGAVAVIVTFARMRKKKHLLSLSGLLDERPSEVKGVFTVRLEGHYRGRDARFVLEPGGKNKPSKFHALLGCRVPLSFEIHKEYPGSGILKALRLVKDLEIGDPRLDADYVFSCDETDRFANWMRGSPVVWEALDSLLHGRHMAVLAMQDGRLKATRHRYGRDDLDVEHVRGILDDLERIVQSLETGA